MKRISEILKRKRMFRQPAKSAKIRDVADRKHQMIELDDMRVRSKSGAGSDGPILDAYGFNFAHMYICARK